MTTHKEIKNPITIILVLLLLILVVSILTSCGYTEQSPQPKPPTTVVSPNCNNLQKSLPKLQSEILSMKSCTDCNEPICQKTVIFRSKCVNTPEEAIAETDITTRTTVTRIYNGLIQVFGTIQILGEEKCNIGEPSLCSGWVITGKYCL